ncbi:MAG: hypothetical protein ABIE14_03910 [Patescibacteria group bacterium]
MQIEKNYPYILDRESGDSILPALNPKKGAKELRDENKVWREKIATTCEITPQNLFEAAKKILLEEFKITKVIPKSQFEEDFVWKFPQFQKFQIALGAKFGIVINIHGVKTLEELVGRIIQQPRF